MKESFESGIYSGNPKEALADLQRLVDDLDRDELGQAQIQFFPADILKHWQQNIDRRQHVTARRIHMHPWSRRGLFWGGGCLQVRHPDLFLKAYDMENYDYKSNNIGNVAMRRPAICINAFVQPDVLLKWYQNTKLRGRGMIQRFLVLFAYKPVYIFQDMCLSAAPKSESLLVYNSKNIRDAEAQFHTR